MDPVPCVCTCACSSILPIPFAISKTGVLVGCLTMLVVAWANDATSCMLIRAAGATGKPTYEALAEWAGGKPWKVRICCRRFWFLMQQASLQACCAYGWIHSGRRICAADLISGCIEGARQQEHAHESCRSVCITAASLNACKGVL